MSQKSPRGRIPLNRRIGPSSSSTYKLRRRLQVRRGKPPLRLIKRCKSEPALLTLDVDAAMEDIHDGVIAQRRACTDGFRSSQDLVLPYSPPEIEGYNKDKDRKVVVNVTVEGSPGPVRTMLKLGSSVEETMEIIKKQYSSEGRSPQLHLSTFELHQSYFSLQRLDKSHMIGDIGSRSFYMRKCNNENTFTRSEIISTRENNSPPQNPIIVFPNFIFNSFKKIMKLSCKLSKLIGCIDSDPKDDVVVVDSTFPSTPHPENQIIDNNPFTPKHNLPAKIDGMNKPSPEDSYDITLQSYLDSRGTQFLP
ncbi:hypothetical protein SSX86_001393 [Deinandra increscens subsp. villosa]|uniref:DUF7054 domain-containing protein n=1 Tax=Deinandra increscens subsp. villosa TaxID=3103831 RepID=A0AAP0DR81_9ASTR